MLLNLVGMYQRGSHNALDVFKGLDTVFEIRIIKSRHKKWYSILVHVTIKYKVHERSTDII